MEGLFNERLQVRTRQLQQRVESLSKQLAAHKEHNARLQHEHDEAAKKVYELEKHLEAERERCHKLSVSLSSCRHSNNKYRERMHSTHHDFHLNRLIGTPPDPLANAHPYEATLQQPPSICCCNRIHAADDFQPDCVGIMPARRPNPRLIRQKMNKRLNNPPPDYLQPNVRNRSLSPGARAPNNMISCACTGVVEHTDPASAVLPSHAFACCNCSCPLHESVTEALLLHTLPQPNVDNINHRSRTECGSQLSMPKPAHNQSHSCSRGDGCGKGCAVTNLIQSDSPTIVKCQCAFGAPQSRTTRMAAGSFRIQLSSPVVVVESELQARPHQQSQTSARTAPSDSIKSTSTQISKTAKYSEEVDRDRDVMSSRQDEESCGDGTTGQLRRNDGSSDDAGRPAAAGNRRVAQGCADNNNDSELSEYLSAEVDVLRLFERMKFESLRAENEVLRNALQQQKLKGKVVEREVEAQQEPQVSVVMRESKAAEALTTSEKPPAIEQGTSSNSEAAAVAKDTTVHPDRDVNPSSSMKLNHSSSCTRKYSDDLLSSSNDNDGANAASTKKKGGDAAASAVEVRHMDGGRKQKNMDRGVVGSGKEVGAAASKMVLVGEDMDVVLLRRRMRRRFGSSSNSNSSSSQRNVNEEDAYEEEGGGGFLDDDEEFEEDVVDDDEEEERLMRSSAVAASSGSVRLLRDLIFCRAPCKSQRRSVSAARSRRPI